MTKSQIARQAEAEAQARHEAQQAKLRKADFHVLTKTMVADAEALRVRGNTPEGIEAFERLFHNAQIFHACLHRFIDQSGFSDAERQARWDAANIDLGEPEEVC